MKANRKTQNFRVLVAMDCDGFRLTTRGLDIVSYECCIRKIVHHRSRVNGRCLRRTEAGQEQDRGYWNGCPSKPESDHPLDNAVDSQRQT